MNTETIVMCVVALIIGMLLAHMLKNVCGCQVVEGASTVDRPEGGGFGVAGGTGGVVSKVLSKVEKPAAASTDGGEAAAEAGVDGAEATLGAAETDESASLLVTCIAGGPVDPACDVSAIALAGTAGASAGLAVAGGLGTTTVGQHVIAHIDNGWSSLKDGAGNVFDSL